VILLGDFESDHCISFDIDVNLKQSQIRERIEYHYTCVINLKA
jgi:hypothetical protein